MRAPAAIIALLVALGSADVARAQASDGIAYDNMNQRWIAAPSTCVPAHGRIMPEACWTEADGDRAWSSVFERAMDACGAAARGGCTLELGKRVYTMGRELNVCSCVSIVGCSAGPNAAGCSVLQFPAKSDGVVFRAGGECPRRPGAKDGSGWSTISHVTLVGTLTATIGDGLVIGERIDASDLAIGYFGHDAIRAVSDPPRNADGSTLDWIRVQRVGRAAIFVDGGIANALNVSGLQPTSACWLAKRGDKCASVLDSSFLGTRYESLVIHSTKSKDGVAFPGVICEDGPCTLDAPYVEFDSLPSRLSRYSTVIGGIIRTSSTSVYQDLRPASPLMRAAHSDSVWLEMRDDTRLKIGPHGIRVGTEIGGPPLLTDAAIAARWPDGSIWIDERPKLEPGACAEWRLIRRAWICSGRIDP